jgi:hypothetical protein
MKTKIGVALLAAALLLIPGKAAAKAEISMVTAAGPDWYGEIEITDPQTLSQLEIYEFLEFENPVTPPGGLGEGYLLNHGYLDEEQFVAFTRMMFFPGSPSYAYFIELVNGATPMDGKWYRVTSAGAAALLEGLRAEGARLTVDPISGEMTQSTGLAQFVAAGLALFVGGSAGWLLGRNRRHLIKVATTK